MRSSPFFPERFSGASLRFYGNGIAAPDQDRVKITIDNSANADPCPPADIGGADFTIEFWMKAAATDNPAGAVTCGANINWIYGNIVVDRDRYNQDRSLACRSPMPYFRQVLITARVP